MIKSCFKLCSIHTINVCLLRCPGISLRLISGQRLCSHYKQNEDKMGKVVYFHKSRKVLNEMQLIEFQNRFQNQRYDKLSQINASDYKKWLTTVCLEAEDSSVAFERKFKSVELICRVYNDILEKTFRVPSKVTTHSMLELLEVDSIEDITKQIHYLYDLEMKRWTEKQFRREGFH